MVIISKKGLRVNGAIKVRKVRLVDETNEQVGIVDTQTAMDKASEAGLDLVEVSPNSEPPVCRIMDYGKYLYEQKRKARESKKKAKQHASSLKEIRLRPETEQHDLEVKVKHGREFIEKGHKVQFSVFFRGRQMLHQERGEKMLEQIQEQLSDIARVLRPPKMTNRRMILVMAPNKK